MTGTIFDIKEFSVHDGPGPRVTVFFKGCPLRCRWCHNPEGLSCDPQLLWKKTLCVGCGQCGGGCEHPDCSTFDRCWHRCTKGALSVSGTRWDVDSLTKKLNGYAPMLTSMGGGITLSGGEPLYQPDFALALLEQLEGTHRAIQTSGFAAAEVFERMLRHVDYVMMDIKLADPALHRQYTGVDNQLILRNFAHLRASGKPYVIRVPLIPGIADTQENLCAISEIVGDSAVELLEYNQFAPAKYELLQQAYPLQDLQRPNTVDLSWFQNATLRKF